jgi:protein CpxP
MFINRKNWLIGASMAAAIAASTAAWSMGPGGEHDPARMLDHMADRLDLNAEQKAAVEQLLADARKAGAADRKRLRSLREELMAMKGDFDADRARQIADEIGEITGRMVFEMSKTWSAVYAQLDSEQQQQLDEMVKQREAHRGKWRAGGGIGPH